MGEGKVSDIRALLLKINQLAPGRPIALETFYELNLGQALAMVLEGVHKTITRRGNLTEQVLSYPKRWTDGKDGWPEIVQRNSNLRTLEADIKFLTPAALLPLARYCTQLVTVVINCYDASALLRTPDTADSH